MAVGDLADSLACQSHPMDSKSNNMSCSKKPSSAAKSINVCIWSLTHVQGHKMGLEVVVSSSLNLTWDLLRIHPTENLLWLGRPSEWEEGKCRSDKIQT